jgi:hypothetical protein
MENVSDTSTFVAAPEVGTDPADFREVVSTIYGNPNGLPFRFGRAARR